MCESAEFINCKRNLVWSVQQFIAFQIVHQVENHCRAELICLFGDKNDFVHLVEYDLFNNFSNITREKSEMYLRHEYLRR